MQVKTLTKFNDAVEGVARNVGDVFEVAPERYEQIMAYRFDLVELCEPEPDSEPEEQPEAEPEPKKAPAKNRKTK